MEIKDIVLKTLKESTEPLKGGEIAEKSGVDKKEVDKAMTKLKATGDIVSPKKCFWTAK